LQYITFQFYDDFGTQMYAGKKPISCDNDKLVNNFHHRLRASSCQKRHSQSAVISESKTVSYNVKLVSTLSTKPKSSLHPRPLIPSRLKVLNVLMIWQWVVSSNSHSLLEMRPAKVPYPTTALKVLSLQIAEPSGSKPPLSSCRAREWVRVRCLLIQRWTLSALFNKAE